MWLYSSGHTETRTNAHCRFKAPTAAGHAQTVVPNQLNREFTVQAPNTVYVGDITYLPPGEGWLYLAIVLALEDVSDLLISRVKLTPQIHTG
jgi:transposase InsO family protein